MDADPTGLLVIGYGNTLRQDDGVGPRVAALLDDFELPGVETLSCPQLSPEHARPVAAARTVVFVDAMVGVTGPVRLRRLAPAVSSRLMTHSADPGALLALAREVYGRSPRAWLLAVPARKMDFGEDFSAVATKGVYDAVNVLCRFAQLDLLHHVPRPVADAIELFPTHQA